MGWCTTTAAAGDLSSNTAVASRILAMVDEAIKKSKVDVDSTQLKYALYSYAKGLSAHPEFLEARLLNLESMLLAGDDNAVGTKADPSNDVEVLLPMFRLAEMAYEVETDDLVGKLKEEGYEMHDHHKSEKAGEVGYFVALNHTEKVMVISIKGTSSLADALTDCVANTMPHECNPFCPYSGANTGREIRCHEGMLTAALNVCNNVETVITDMAIKNGYMTKIVGHSLGAGTAALLGILLRTKEAYEWLRDSKNMHVWSFACPAVVDLESCLESKSFITSIVNKSDVVPRCSIANLQVFTKMLASLAKKMEEDNGGKAVGYFAVQDKVGSAAKGEVELPLEVIKDFMEKSQADVEVANKDNLYVPGQIVLLYDKKSGVTVDEKEELTTGACLTVGSHKYLRMIEFNGGTIADHYCDSYLKSLNDCLKPPSV